MSAFASELAPLEAALDDAAAPVSFWWRDDDAGRAHPRLDQLLALSRGQNAPLALAVVPAWLEERVVAAVLACPQATVLQHGWAHESHARPGERKVELGGAADPGELPVLLAEGRARLAAAFGERFLPVMVPPWNRMAAEVCACLRGIGLAGVSLWRGTVIEPFPPGLRRIDTHLDLVDWRAGRVARPAGALAAELAGQVRSGVQGPLGILSHHLVMDEEAFAVLDALLCLLRTHPRARLLGAGELFRDQP